MLTLFLSVMSFLPARLTVDGPRLLEPDGKPVRLTGFNWQHGRTGDDPGGLMRRLAPNSTVARLVGVQWGNTHPLQHHPEKECMTMVPPHYFNDRCFDDLDPWIRSATDAGLWVILAVRGEYAAGQLYKTEPGTVLFRNATLRTMAYAMWQHVASHYASFERIAAYEILSEPRDKGVDAQTVREFYEGGCAAVQQTDPRTPCLVGAAPYYKLFRLGESTLLRNNTNVIYTFDYFNPDAFVFGNGALASGSAVTRRVDSELLPQSAPAAQQAFYRHRWHADGREDVGARGVFAPPIPIYGSTYPCSTLYYGWADVCATWNVSSPDEHIPFDVSWHRHNLETFAAPLGALHHVPLFLNQFEVVHGVDAEAGRYDYIRDLLILTRSLNIGWAWWTWAGGSDDGWKHGSSEVVFHWPNGSMMVDTDVLDTMQPYF